MYNNPVNLASIISIDTYLGPFLYDIFGWVFERIVADIEASELREPAQLDRQ